MLLTAAVLFSNTWCAAAKADSKPDRAKQESSSTLRLPALFADHMVLQRDQPIPVWGWAAPESKIVVSLGNQKADAVADAKGRWSATLPERKAGGPFTLGVKSGKESKAFSDVLVGEVWLCTGQSNMYWSVKQTTASASEIANAKYPDIRLFQVNIHQLSLIHI